MKTWEALKAAGEGKKIRRKCWAYGVYSFRDESRFCNPALITHYGWKNFNKTLETARLEDLNVPPPIEAGVSCFSENSTTNSEELWRLTLSLQA